MILPIIFFILILLVVALLIMFIFYMLFPSIKRNLPEDEVFEDPVISRSEKNYIIPQKQDYSVSDHKAIVLCSCNKKFNLDPITFNTEHNCFMMKSVHGSGTDCKYACIGLGDCVRVCPQQAISIINRTAVISSLCCGCGRCAAICPQSIIKLVPKNTEKYKLCNKTDENVLTSCTEKDKEVKITWNDKKDFKIWQSCYKIIKHLL